MSTKINDMVRIALMAAVICILGPLSVPVGPVPISLSNFAVILSVYLLGLKRGTISCIVYILLGLFGLPIFSGFQGGIGKLFGVTGGYIFGYIFLAVFTGIFVEKYSSNYLFQFLGMVIGNILCYVFGTVWFVFLTKMNLAEAVAICVVPFILGDVIKMLVALFAGNKIRKRIILANLY